MQPGKPYLPSLLWLAAIQIISVLIAFDFAPALIGFWANWKARAICVVVLLLLHYVTTYILLEAYNDSTKTNPATALYITSAIVVTTALPAEPRITQSLCAVAFIAVVLWQTLLKFLEE